MWITALSADGARNEALAKKNLILLGSEMDFTLSSGSLSGATISLPYDANKVPAGLSVLEAKVAYYNLSTQEWEVQGNVTLQADLLVSTVTHFSIYAPVIELPPLATEVSDLYVYPNPAVGSDSPVIHVKMGRVDTVEIDIYDTSGARVHSTSFDGGSPQAAEDGRIFYEYTWTGDKASGVYIAVVKGKTSQTTVSDKVKFAVVR